MGADLFSPQPVTFPRYARVVLERGIDSPDGLTYGVPDSIGPLAPGDRVEAPLGRGDSRAAGYVFEIVTEPGIDPAKIKPIRRRTGSGLPPTLIALADWISRYYCTPLGMTLGGMVPAAVKSGVGTVTRVEIEPTCAALPEGTKITPSLARALESLARIEPMRFPMPARDAADAAGLRTLGALNKLVALGVYREVPRVSVRAVWADYPLPADTSVTLTPEQQRAVDVIGGALGSFRAHLLRGVTGSGKTEVYLRVLEKALERGECAIVLVPEISLTPQTARRFLARFTGPRGSGSGGGVSGTVSGGGGVAILHSGLTAAQRNQQWSAVASGAARIVIGARSAIFAPFPPTAKLGLIVVDEEHEDGYKQDQLPRYHARDVAIKRAQLEGCPVVLGSATPSLESWHNAQTGRYALLELPDRVAGASLPRVEIVDLAEERRARPWTDQRVHLLGPTLERAIGETLDSNGQLILLLNRRGWGNYICCPDHRCGWVLTCDSCDAAMVYHRDRLPAPGMPAGVVRCHHCLSERTLPTLCPICSRRVTVFGMGTQRVEDELTRLFPALAPGETMLRLDGDTTHTGKHWFAALERFARGEVRVLLGTQMIAKGLDFPGIKLVGVVNADTAINMPDFRAAERTFQLVNQVAGRTGRPGATKSGGAFDPGRVIVQTFTPQAAPIRLAATHDYVGFATEELAQRKRCNLPPYTRMARIVVRDTDHARALAHANEVEEALREAIEDAPRARTESAARAASSQTPLPEGERMSPALRRQERGGVSRVRLRGPFPCPIARINNFHRLAIELLADSPGEVQRVITHARNRSLLKSDAKTAVDVDPMAMM